MNKITVKFFFLFAILSYSFSFAQQSEGEDLGSYKKNFIEGSLLLNENNKILALKYFKNAYMYDSSNSNINYLIGICYLDLENKKKFAEKHLLKAIKNVTKNYKDADPSEKKAPVLAFMYMAKAYLYAYKFTEAEEMLTLFEYQMKKKDEVAKIESEATRNQIKYARIFTSSPTTDIKFTHFDDSINSVYPEFSQIISLDENMMIFSARRKTNYGGYQLALDGYAIEDVLISFKNEDGKWSSPKSISDNINSFGSEIPVGLSFDGQTLLLQKDDLGDVNLYYSNWDGYNWTLPERFGSNINSESLELSACLSSDGNLLYFSSNREGGFGGMDIWRCVKLPNGKWSLAQNLGPTINTALNEDCPFLTADGKVFYFSSEGHQSIGGFDCMYSVINEDGEYSKPINLGFPINSSDDDLYFYPTFDNHRLYFSSSREGTKGERDIFLVEKEKSFPVNVSLLKCKIKNTACDSFPSDLSVRVFAPLLNQSPSVLKPMRETGTFSVILNPGIEYFFEFYQKEKLIFSETYIFPEEFSNEALNKFYFLEKKSNNCEELEVRLDSTRPTQLLMDIFVLNNKTEGKPVSGVSVTIAQDKKNSFSLLTDNLGKTSNVLIKNGAKVSLQFFTKTMQSAVISFDSGLENLNSKISKIFYFNELFPSNTETAISPKKENKTVSNAKTPIIKLNVAVFENKKSNKPINDANFFISGTDGTSQIIPLSGGGNLEVAKLSQNVNYEFYVERNGIQSAKQILSTHGITKNKSISRKIYFSETEEQAQVPDNSSVTGNTFTFYFKYNMNQVDNEAPEFKEFIRKIAELNSINGKVKISITTSSSSVPTHKYKNNKELSSKRLKKSLDILFKSLAAENIQKNTINVVSKKAIVSGPKYSGDPRNKSKYEKYQYVMIEAK